jgi:outer membrane protein OmpA-like peptidoglycan-associated protein
MASKKYGLLSGLLAMLVSCSFAQDSNSSYDLRDSSLIPAKRIPQHQEFLNNAYPFPAKPRNEWEIGAKGGWSAVAGAVRYWGPTGAWGIHVRKALGYTFSIRAEYDWMRSRGLNFQPSTDFQGNSVLVQYYHPGVDNVFYNYRTTIHQLSLQGVVTLNNIQFHKAKTGFTIYGFGGISAFSFSTFYKVISSAGTPYDYSGIIAQFNGVFDYSNRKDVRTALKNLLNGGWTTIAQRDNSRPTLGGPPIRPALDLGVGGEFKLNDRFNIALEDKVTFTPTNLIDGQQWQETGDPEARAQTKNDHINFLSLGLNYNIGNHAVEPLWWINPLDYAYSEINNPRHMKLPKPVLDDTDGDGVTDQFDLEPNTPHGCPVDSHGVSLDTDGDGVPDCRDKEKITPTICQPVDADGVGKCPDPECCKDIKAMLDSGNFGGTGGRRCSIGDLPSVTFKGRSVTVSKDGQALLASVAEKMRNNPNCKVAVIGYGESSKSAQQLSWDRVNEVIKYLVEKEGISIDRFIFRYGQSGGDENTIDLKDGTGEEGPNTVPAPHPNLRKHN